MVPTHALQAHRFLLRAALTGIHVFAWIFLLEYFHGLSHDITEAFVRLMFLYALSQMVIIFVTPYAAQSLKRGTKRLSVFAILFLVASLVVLAATLLGLFPGHSLTGPMYFAVLMGLYRALYFVPYRVEEQAFGSGTIIPAEFFIAVVPALMGVMLATHANFGPLLLCAAAVVILVSLVPLIFMPEIYERFSWQYGQVFGELLEPRFRSVVKASLLQGLEASVLLILWPLFVFEFIARSYSLFGVIVTLTLILAIPARMLSKKLLRSREFLYKPLIVTAWIFRIFTASSLGVVVVETYAIAGRGNQSDLDIYTREQAADNATYVDEITALKEVAFAFGRLAMALIIGLSASLFTLPIALTLSCITAALCAVFAQRISEQN